MDWSLMKIKKYVLLCVGMQDILKQKEGINPPFLSVETKGENIKKVLLNTRSNS